MCTEGWATPSLRTHLDMKVSLGKESLEVTIEFILICLSEVWLTLGEYKGAKVAIKMLKKITVFS